MIDETAEKPEQESEAGNRKTGKARRQDFERGLKLKEPTEESLYRFALWYLERFAATAEGLRKGMEKRVRKAIMAELVEAEEGNRRIAAVLERITALGYLNDEAFADGKAASLLRAGKPPRHILETLKAKGVESETASATLDRLAEETPDLARAAAVRYAQRRRLGFFRLADHDKFRDKDLATLMRAGHSPALAREIIDADDDTLAVWLEAKLI
jgi:regulatory protein